MKRVNHHDAITHLAMPERSIPILVPSSNASGAGWIVWGDEPQHVRVLPADLLRLFLDEDAKREFEKRFGVVSERERRHLLYLLGLADAIKKRDTRELRGVVKRYTEPIVDADHQEDVDWLLADVLRSPLRQLGEALNYGISEVRLVVWWAKHEKRFAPGLYCANVSDALHALALSRIGARRRPERRRSSPKRRRVNLRRSRSNSPAWPLGRLPTSFSRVGN